MNNENENTKNKILAQERALIFLLIIFPILFYFYLVFPVKPSIEFMGVRITSHWYKNLEMMFWILSIKGSLILLLSLWFLYNKEWWRYAILPILCYSIFQFTSALNEDLNFYPIFPKYYSIYFFIIFIPIYLILDKIINYSPRDLNNKIEDLTDDTLTTLIKFDARAYTDLKKELELLRLKKERISQKKYLVKLMAIQAAIERKAKDE